MLKLVMKSLVMAAFLAVPIGLAAAPSGPAVAHSWKDDGRHGKKARAHEHRKHRYKEKGRHRRHGYEYEYRDGDCEYEYEEDEHGFEEEYECRRRARYRKGPPPWAPAHGYRRHRHHDHDHDYHAHDDDGYDTAPIAYEPPFDIGLGGCNRELLGGLLGGAAGAIVGAQIGDGDGQLVAVGGGALLGLLVGSVVGRHMDEVDQGCVGQTLEHADDGQQVTWVNPDNGATHEVLPTRTVQTASGAYCREYTATSMIGGRPQQIYGRACRQPDGTWRIVE